jgi:hypothetical protein
MNLISRIGWMLAKPDKVYLIAKNEKPGRSWAYFFLLLLIGNLPLAIVVVLAYKKFLAPLLQNFSLPNMGFAAVIVVFLSTVILTFLIFLITVLFNTLGLNILRAKIRVADSIKVQAYAWTPLLLTIAFIPFTVLASIWSFFLTLKGFKELNNINRLKTFLVIAFYLLLVVLASLIASSTGGKSSY